MQIFIQYSFTKFLGKMSANGLGIAEGGDFQHKSSIEERMLKLVQMSSRSRSAPLLAIPCCA